MKYLLITLLSTLTLGCSSMITRGELSSCQKQCQSKDVKISKKDSKVNCACKEDKVVMKTECGE